MVCPVCSVDLTMSERQGVEIDYCPKCRGVWLDRGELDKIIERSHAGDAAPAAQPIPAQPYPAQQYPPQHMKQPYGGDYYKQKKRKNFLDDIFDF
jgi:Zn-finger nucleic acid-binding protein